MTIDQPLDTVDMMLNMGPQHPSTHGVFRMVLTVDGENIVDVVPHIGYLHRGSEKLCEAEDYRQIIDLFDRLDYVSSFNNELPYVMAVEKLMGLEVPERAQYIRLIMCELNRIASHLLFYGAFGGDCGAVTPFLYGFREREQMQALFESVSGARMMHGYFRVGGVFRDLPDDFQPEARRPPPGARKGHHGVRRPAIEKRAFPGAHHWRGRHRRGDGHQLRGDGPQLAGLGAGLRPA